MVVEGLLVALVIFIVKFFDWVFCLQLNRPMVTGTLVGIVLGHPAEGITLGAAIELVFLGAITIGGSVPQEIAIGGVLATAYAILLKQNVQVAIALAVPISILGAFFYNILKLFFTALVEKLDRHLDNKDEKNFNRLFLSQLLIFPSAFAIVVFIGIVAGTNTIETIVNAIPPVVMNGLTTAAGILPALGFGLLLKMLWQKNIALFFFAGFAMAAYLNLSNMGVAIFAACISVYICISDYTDKKKIAVNDNSKISQTSEMEDFFNE
ncbi:N-acetylgalactosamine permease IIC component 1 [Clostridium puniceum]|uniref:N-acetylgalactosamine permease IIC component 1 n=1 Tax=Clostridium puniceum TaxID=29367 RepID=A0A1S8TXE5_9CLOT|nr:PTS sugar transporter subunit IIC [Clostridium puniceum]OOM82259.1 N-acetylgalactosamine permease IIC component 1 [Clostridium puniceum]